MVLSSNRLIMKLRFKRSQAAAAQPPLSRWFMKESTVEPTMSIIPSRNPCLDTIRALSRPAATMEQQESAEASIGTITIQTV